MNRYSNYSREELMRRIEELEGREVSSNVDDFKTRFSKQILESLPDMLTVLTREGNLVELLSSEQTNHIGIPSDQFDGVNVCDFLPAEAAHCILNNLDNVFATGCVASATHDITLDVQTHNYESRIMPLVDGHALCICREVTNERRAQRELEMVKYALTNVDEEIYACELDGTMEYANELFRHRHELYDDLSSHKVYEFWAFPANIQHWEERLQKIREANGVYNYTLRQRDEKGQIMAWDIMAYLVYDEATRRELVWFFGRDVTERLDQEIKLKKMNLIMESILNNVPVYLFVKDPNNEFRYIYWNKAFEEFSHIPASKALGHTDMEIFPSTKDAEKFRHDDLELLRNGTSASFIEEYVAMNGETRIVNTTKSLVPVENSLPLIIGVSWDITDLKNAEMEIVEARIRAEESDRLKSAFLANMSHEIRTPLNAIVGFSRLIGEAETQEEKQQYAEIIDNNSELLLQLINDILDLSKIEAGTLTFNYKNFDLNDLCRSEYETLKSRLPAGVNFVFEQKHTKAEIFCDQNRLAQVITNLVNNAIKFTDKGDVRFGFDLCDGRVEFYVQDSGIGIPEDKIDNVFNRFIKLNEFVAGTGLGLAISKMIVEKLDGSISVESKIGQGTRFNFSIPMIHRERHGVDDEPVAGTPERVEGMWTLLVAEDSETNYRLVEAVLRHRFKLIRARTGEEAVELCEKHWPDAILMDIRLPVMDGLEATRRIRAKSATLPIIAMSAYAFSNEIEAARKAGCNDFIAKPLSLHSLRNALNACLIPLPVE